MNKPNLSFEKISPPFDSNQIRDGIIVDLHSELSDTEELFITNCCVQGIPVFNSISLQDQLDGKLHVLALTENAIGQLNPPSLYLSIKRLWESVLILLISPIIATLFLVISAIIFFDNQGPIFYKQLRTGQKGKLFYIYKFRTMSPKGNENTEQRFATQEENRITTIGKLLRQSRLDELPQVWNVLKGDMALIGPRPEQPDFVEQFKQHIPFYHYRHIVKPGITGWAQVIQGYTDSTDTTKHKLAYDFYTQST
ncbi:sugar transferase [Vibrio algivorus]|nr:sugar transferase [Vibrio algivorus]